MHTAFRYNFGTLAVRGSLACLTVRYDFDGHTFAIRIHNTVFCKQMQDHLGHCSTHGRLRSGDMAPWLRSSEMESNGQEDSAALKMTIRLYNLIKVRMP